MTTMRTITVLGLDGTGLPPAGVRALARADLVVGGHRHLAMVAALLPPGAATVALGPLAGGLAALAARTGPAVVLASGDPGWFGIVRTLAALGEPLRVLPAPSSLSRLAAATGQPWDDIATFSAHGRDPRGAVNAARALPAVAVLTGPALTVADLARALDGWPRQLTVGERLGHDDERVVSCPAADAAAMTWADPNIVLVTDPQRRPAARMLGHDQPAAGMLGHDQPVARMLGHDQPAALRPDGWALPESAFQHRDSMITKSEVRALALARLAPAVGRLVWDVGAGSGSVAVECARFGAAAVAIDADPAAVDLIRHNAQRHNVAVRAVTGAAPAALAGLPEPDAVFVGGGGAAVVTAVAALGVPRIVVACAALDHMLAARAALRAAGYACDGVQLAASRLATLPDGAVRLVARNPVTLLWGIRDQQGGDQ